MIDNQENKFPAADEPENPEIPVTETSAEETQAAPGPEMAGEPVAEELPAAEISAEEEAVPAEEKKAENIALEDGFSEVTEPVPETPPEQIPQAESEIPTVEEPGLPVHEEAEQPEIPQNSEVPQEISPAAAQQTPAAAQQTWEVAQQTWEVAQQTPAQPEIPPIPGQPSGTAGGPLYPQGYQGYPQGYPVQQQGYSVPPYGYPQPEILQGNSPVAAQQAPVPDGQPLYQPQNQQHYGYPQPVIPQQTAAPQNQPPYQGYPQQQAFVPQASVPQNQPYYQPQPGYYGQPGWPPKKKMSIGLKVFIWIASILAAAAIIGFGSYLAYNVIKGPSFSDYLEGNSPTNPSIPRLPGDRGDRDDRDKDEIPDFDDGVIPPDESDPRPDVDVTPNNEGITIHPQPKGKELSAQEVYQKVVKSTVTVAVTYNGSNSTGTGIIATSDGYIITNSHVVMNSKSSVVEITAYDGQTYEAVVVGVDRTTDLAILKTNDYSFTPAEFGDSEELTIGDSVLAIGNPGGAKFSGSMTGGYISGLDRAVGSYSENGMTYIQTDAAINPGNSGGPLVNMYGQVVGINSSKIVSDGYEGMGFAIPVTKAQSIINELLSGGYVKGRTRLGITGMDVTNSMVMLYNVPQGFVITEISEESAFTGTEAEVGDIIIALDGETVTGLTDISNLLLKHAPGDQATVTLYRQNGTELDVTITLLEDKGETQK